MQDSKNVPFGYVKKLDDVIDLVFAGFPFIYRFMALSSGDDDYEPIIVLFCEQGKVQETRKMARKVLGFKLKKLSSKVLTPA